MLYTRFLLAIVLTLPFIAGCGGAKFSTEFVEGIVTLDGAPLADAVVSFSPTGSSGKYASGRTDATGKYVLTAMQGGGEGKGTLAGEYVVLVTKHEVKQLSTPRPNQGGGPPITTETVNTLPAVYNDAKAAKLTATVASGQNKFDFDLSSKEK